MKKHKKYKRILGVVLLLIIIMSVSVILPTYAEEPIETETPLTCQDLAEKYGLYIQKGDGANEYIVIKDDSYACGENVSATSLKLIKINGINQDGTKVLSAENPKISFNANLIKQGSLEYISVVLVNVDNALETVEVRYEITSEESTVGTLQYEVNPNYNGICAPFRTEVSTMDAKAQNYYKDSISYCWKTHVPIGTNYTEDEIKRKIENAKKNYAAFNSVETTTILDFNKVLSYSQKVSGQYLGSNAGSTTSGASSKVYNLKCRYDFVAGNTYVNKYGETINATDYYVNKDYFYGKQESSSGTITYEYNYAPGNTVTYDQNNVCLRTCEEAVQVEYGPPVASKAGLCFQYKVKVTSEVKCSTAFNAEKPKYETKYCNPAPRCVSLSGVERKKPQAGPTTEFDTCILECDGGKYTQACSKKCYNEVYKKKTSTKLALNYDDVQVARLAQNSSAYSVSDCLADNANYYGCYAYSGNSIKWYRAGQYNSSSRLSLGRWYLENSYNISGLSTGRYIADDEGFYRANYGGGSLCTDNCTWRTTCGKNVYLNPGTAAKDYKKNEEAYESARAACAAGASCSSKTATFTISVNYDTKDKSGNTTVHTIDFPYSTESDKISSTGAESIVNTANSTNSTILDYAGCYTNIDERDNYMVEWSFPGTYIHNKTGEITFKRPDDTSGWYYEDNKFCMPLNASSVNAKWWEWYKIAGTNFDKSCFTRAQIEEELAGTPGTSNGYNINAKTTDFGHFGWNFDISCFYGLRNEVCDIITDDTKKCCSACPSGDCQKTTGTNYYTVRAINREELFPNTELREIGFNWTDAAKSSKNSKYKIDPVTLIQNIQTNANQIYNNDVEYLDYQFYLTPSTLRKIRDYNKNYEYGEWMGITKEINGINAYVSNLWNHVGTEWSINLENVNGAVLATGCIGENNQTISGGGRCLNE